MNEEEIFQDAAALPATARAAYLVIACKGEPRLRSRIERLLASHDHGDFMQRAAGLLVPPQIKAEECGEWIGDYKLLEQIGEGGCGVVYMAQQERPIRRIVALKIIKLGMDTKSVIARFQQERQALALMDHPNIAKVFDAGATPQGRPFFVMELVRGIRITDFCDQNNLSTAERLQLFIAVCHAIQHAHQKGIIHRDIKPSNILVTLHDGVPVPKVIDFGIAKATTGQRLTDQTLFTAFQQFMGTPAYMSPEQAEMSGLDIDTRSDIYSLGVLLYELLIGQTPFDGRQLMASGIDAMRKTIREKEPVRPSTRLTQELVASETGPRQAADGLAIPSEDEVVAESRRRLRMKEQINRLRGDLDWIVMKCLDKDRSRRYATANDLATDLKRHLANEPVIARPPSNVYKLQKAWRRNKLVFTATAAVTIALLMGTILSAWQAFEARRARNEELKQRLVAQAERDNARTAQTRAEDAEQAANRARQLEEKQKISAEHHLYVANMNRAGQAWEENNYHRLRQLLEETRPSPNKGFEWYYWQRQAHLNLKTFRGHVGRVVSVSFSPDGQRLVTGGWDESVRIWSVATGRALLTLAGHKGFVKAVCFSQDGQRILSAGSDQTMRFWDSATGKELANLNTAQGSINAAAYSRDSRWIVTGGEDGTAKVWNAATRELLLILKGHTGPVTSVTFSPDGSKLLSGSLDRTARIWEMPSGKPLPLIRHEKEVYAVLFSSDGQRVITGTVDPVARMWDATTGVRLPLSLESRTTMTALAISQDGKHIVSGSWVSTAHLWNAANGREERRFLGHVKGLFSVAISPDGMLIATAGNDGGVKLWDARGGRELLKPEGANPTVIAVSISPDGSRILVGTGIFEESGRIAGAGNHAAQVWDTKSKKKIMELAGHKTGVSSITYSKDGSKILTASGDQTAKIWDATDGSILHTLKGPGVSISSATFFPDGGRIVTAGQDGTASVWETDTEKEIFRLKGHTGPISSVVVSPDGKWILSGSYDGTARLWVVASGQLARKIETELERIYFVAFSPDSRWIMAGGWGNEAKVWDLSDSENEPIVLRGHNAPIASGAFSLDGQRIVTGSFDGTVRVWESSTGSELLRLIGHTGPVYSVAFTPEGERIISGGYDQAVRIWESAKLEQVAAWEAEEASSDVRAARPGARIP